MRVMSEDASRFDVLSANSFLSGCKFDQLFLYPNGLKSSAWVSVWITSGGPIVAIDG